MRRRTGQIHRGGPGSLEGDSMNTVANGLGWPCPIRVCGHLKRHDHPLFFGREAQSQRIAAAVRRAGIGRRRRLQRIGQVVAGPRRSIAGRPGRISLWHDRLANRRHQARPPAISAALSSTESEGIALLLRSPMGNVPAAETEPSLEGPFQVPTSRLRLKKKPPWQVAQHGRRLVRGLG